MTFIATTGTNVVSPALPALGSALTLSEAQLGLIITVYTLPAIFISPIMGTLADRYGRRPVVLPSLLLFGVSGTAIAFVDSFQLILLFRLFQGIAFAGIMPLTITLIGDYYSGEWGSAAQGFRASANGVNQIIIFPIAGFLAGILWQYAFLLYASAFLAFVIVYFYLPPVELERVSHLSVGWNWFSRTRFAQFISNSSEVMNLTVTMLVLGGFVRFVFMFGILTFLPLFVVRELGGSPAAAGSVLALLSVRVVISPFANQLLRMFNRLTALAVLFIGLSVGTALIPFAPSVLWLAGLIVLWSVVDSLLGPILADAVANSVEASYRARVVSVFQISKNLGKTITPVALGLLLAVSNFTVIFAVMGLSALVYGVLLAVLVRT
ncbi:MFS transporter [Haladaptatus sp. DJG-WS-42]|uniref:MFS transporter n=1 Tax=Haladaptatus sp. DJG-WS-42 TaxID=3120516 RepID=UPI0030D58C40